MLASCFGLSTAKEVAGFWNENRKALRDIYIDFPDFDISENTVKKIFMVCDFEKMLGRIFCYETSEALLGKICHFAEEEMIFNQDPPNIREEWPKISCFFETSHGIAFGYKVNEPNNFKKGISLYDFSFDPNLTNSVITGHPPAWHSDSDDSLIRSGIDYFFLITNENLKLYRTVSSTFVKTKESSKEIAKKINHEDGTEVTRTITLVPTTFLPKKIKDSWLGLREGCLLKVALQKGGREKAQVKYFISSFPFNLSNIEEWAARAIWHYCELEEYADDLMDVDCHCDIVPGNNTNYIVNSDYLRKWPDRYKKKIKPRHLKSLYENVAKNSPIERKLLILNLLVSIYKAYQEEQKLLDELEHQAELEYWKEYFDPSH